MTTLKIISIIAAIACVIVLIIVAKYTDLLKEKKEGESAYSFSRFQLWIWTTSISCVFCLFWGFGPTDIPELNLTCIVLLGIPAATGVASAVIAQSKIDQAVKNPDVKAYKEPRSFWLDILSDTSNQLSIYRLQNLIFTFIFAVIFIGAFFESDLQILPEFDQNGYAFILMGVSNTAYLVGKGANK